MGWGGEARRRGWDRAGELGQEERERERARRAWMAAFLLRQHLCTYMTVGRCSTSELVLLWGREVSQSLKS